MQYPRNVPAFSAEPANNIPINEGIDVCHALARRYEAGYPVLAGLLSRLGVASQPLRSTMAWNVRGVGLATKAYCLDQSRKDELAGQALTMCGSRSL